MRLERAGRNYAAWVSAAALILTTFGPLFADKIADRAITNERAWQKKLVDDLRKQAGKAQPVIKLNEARSQALVRILKGSEIWSEWFIGTDQNAISLLARDIGDYNCGRPQDELWLEYAEIWAATKEAFGRHAPPELFGIIVLLSNLRKIEQSLDQLASGASDEDARARRAVFRCLKAPYVPLDSDRSLAPSVLLSAQHAVVGFAGREDELASLAEWRDSPAQISLGLLWGEGGQGKTRLASEFALRSAANWVSGRWSTADPDHLRSDIRDLAAIEAPVLAIVDYAEGQEDQILALLNAAQLCSLRLRVLAVARSGPKSDWFLTIEDRPEAGEASAFLSTVRAWELDPLGSALDALQFFNGARRAFGKTDADPAASLPSPALLSPENAQNALFLAAAAYLDVFAGDLAESQTSDPIATILHHEWRYLSRLLHDARLLPVAKQLLALSTLCPSNTHTRADALAKCINELAGDAHLRATLVRTLKRLYPNEGGVGRLQPDILGDRHVCDELPRWDSHECWDDHWFTRLTFGAHGLKANEVGSTAANIARCAGTHSLPTAAARHAPRFLENPDPLFVAVLPYYGVLPDVWRIRVQNTLTNIPDAQLEIVLDAFPHSSVELSEIRSWLTLQLLARYGAGEESELGPQALKTVLACISLSESFASNGKWQLALKAARRAVNISERLRKDCPATGYPALAQSWGVLSTRFGQVGSGKLSVDYGVRSVSMFDALAEMDPERYGLAYGQALLNLSSSHTIARQHDLALKFAQLGEEAIYGYRSAYPDTDRSTIALAMKVLSTSLLGSGDANAALAAVSKAVEELEVLAGSNRDAHLPNLGSAYHEQSRVFAYLRMAPEALAASEKSIVIFSTLVNFDPSGYGHDLAVAWGNRSEIVGQEHPDEAAEAAREGWRWATGIDLGMELAAKLAGDHLTWCRTAGIAPNRELSEWLAQHEPAHE